VDPNKDDLFVCVINKRGKKITDLHILTPVRLLPMFFVFTDEGKEE
jgi:hypothetical protein